MKIRNRSDAAHSNMQDNRTSTSAPGWSDDKVQMGEEIREDSVPKSDNDDGNQMNTSRGATSRGSVKLVYSVIASFDQKKKDIVKGIRFGGLLSFPQLTKLNHRFSKWLLTRVDEPTKSIVVDKTCVYKFGESDVHNVFGVPAAGRDVRDKSLDRSDAAINIVRSRLGINSKEGRSLKAAEAILLKEYGETMDQIEIDAFKTAFIVFVMGHLFPPTTEHNYCSIEYWPALVDPNMIDSFNWAKYIIEELCNAATMLKSDSRKRISVSNMTGCSLFLQVFYLDSVELGELNIPDGTFPRIKDITMEKLKLMIAADIWNESVFSHLADFGASHPKIRQEMRSGDKSPATDQAVDDAEWKTAKKLCQMLQLSNNAQSNIYQHLKRRKEYLMKTFSLFLAETLSQVNSNFYTQLEATASQFGKNKSNMLPDGAGVGSSYNLGQVEFDSDELRATKKQRTATREDEPATNISFMDLLCQSDDLQCELSLQAPNDIPIHRGCSIRADDVDRVEPNMPVNSTGSAVAVSSSQVPPSVALYQNNSWAVMNSRETDDHHTDATRSFIDNVPSLDLRLDILHSGSTMATVSAIDCNATAAQSNDLLMKTPSIASFPSYWYLGEEARKISSSRNKLLQDYFEFEKDTRFTDNINL